MVNQTTAQLVALIENEVDLRTIVVKNVFLQCP